MLINPPSAERRSGASPSPKRPDVLAPEKKEFRSLGFRVKCPGVLAPEKKEFRAYGLGFGVKKTWCSSSSKERV